MEIWDTIIIINRNLRHKHAFVNGNLRHWRTLVNGNLRHYRSTCKQKLETQARICKWKSETLVAFVREKTKQIKEHMDKYTKKNRAFGANRHFLLRRYHELPFRMPLVIFLDQNWCFLAEIGLQMVYLRLGPIISWNRCRNRCENRGKGVKPRNLAIKPMRVVILLSDWGDIAKFHGTET